MLNLSRGLNNFFTRIILSTPSRTTQQLSGFHLSGTACCQNSSAEAPTAATDSVEEKQLTAAEQKRLKNDRTQLIPVETSIRYLKSSAYKQTYGNQLVWEQYRRNHKGPIPPSKTRKTCIRGGVISTGNPCPICRDEYLVLDHHNIDLLKQFISPQTGQVLSYSKTGLCQKKHLELLVAVERAWDYGLIAYDVPFREYDYSEYYGEPEATKKKQSS